jgi:CheY-like chemotaxis protein
MMPDMDGIETLQKIKALDPEIPVAMVTAVWDNHEARQAIEAGAYEYITKPIDTDHLKLAILTKLLPDE